MEHSFKYEAMIELLAERVRHSAGNTGEHMEGSWLSEFDESCLSEAERLNIIFPLIMWEIDNNTLTNVLKDELEYYYYEYIEGRLEKHLVDYEKDRVLKDLCEYYHKVFG